MVTIVVLIILATITVGTLTGDNGIITRAENAKNDALVSGKLENDTLQDYQNVIESSVNLVFTGNNTSGGNNIVDDGGDEEEHTCDYSVLVSSTKATCVTQGSETYKCSGCTLTKTITTGIDSSNHTRGTRTEYVYVNDTTHSKNTVCSSCGEVLSTTSEGHTNDGTGKCTYCEQDITSNHTHSYTVFVEHVLDATCTAQAQNKYACSICGVTTTISEGSLLEHSWNSGEITTEPTTTT